MLTKIVSRFLVLLLLAGAAGLASAQTALPPLEKDAKARLESSPRHGEWVTVEAPAGDKVDAWVVYPERKDRAPVVLVIHEIFGLTDWARSVADQLAAEGFIAVAPDFLSGKGPEGKGSSSLGADAARQLNSALQPAEVVSPPERRGRLGHQAAGRHCPLRRGRLLLGRRHQLPVRHRAARPGRRRGVLRGLPGHSGAGPRARAGAGPVRR